MFIKVKVKHAIRPHPHLKPHFSPNLLFSLNFSRSICLYIAAHMST